MNPRFWGPAFWLTLLNVALEYPDDPTVDQQVWYRRFYETLQFTLPCGKCQENYRRHFQQAPIHQHLGNREQLVNWVIAQYNAVRTDQGKVPLSPVEAQKRILHGQATASIREGMTDGRRRDSHAATGFDFNVWDGLALGLLVGGLACFKQ